MLRINWLKLAEIQADMQSNCPFPVRNFKINTLKSEIKKRLNVF